MQKTGGGGGGAGGEERGEQITERPRFSQVFAKKNEDQYCYIFLVVEIISSANLLKKEFKNPAPAK